MKTHLVCVAAAALMFGATAGQAEIAVSANDGKQMRAGDTITGPEPDSISVLNIGRDGVKLLGSVAAPTTMIGPPGAVAVSKDSKFAIVAAGQKFGGGKLLPDGTISVVDLSIPSNPRIIQTLQTGPGAMGLSISPDGKLVLVAGSDSSTVTAFSIVGKKLTRVGQLQLADKTDPTDVVFTRDGKTAIVVCRAGNKLMLLSVDGTTIADTGKTLLPGRQPYGAVVTPDGKYVISTNLGGALPQPGAPVAGRGGPRSGTISVTNLRTGAVMASVEVGPTPEHVVMSADGKFIAVVVANGTASVKSDPSWNSKLGLLEVYKVGDGTLTAAGRADTGHWGQGATFSKDGKTILVQCAAEREIEVFHFDGKTLARDSHATIAIGARPGSIATAYSR